MTPESPFTVVQAQHESYKGKPVYRYVKAWKDALTSDHYTRSASPNILRDEQGFSALGVLVDVLSNSHKDINWMHNPFMGYCVPVRLVTDNSPLTRKRLGERIRFMCNIDFDTEAHVMKLEANSEFGYSEVTKWLDTLYPPVVHGPSGPGG